jgi:hypothetical protein
MLLGDSAVLAGGCVVVVTAVVEPSVAVSGLRRTIRTTDTTIAMAAAATTAIIAGLVRYHGRGVDLNVKVSAMAVPTTRSKPGGVSRLVSRATSSGSSREMSSG